MSYLKVESSYGDFNNDIAKGEKNDCVVRSLATATGVDYMTAHNFCKEVFGREDKRGTSNFNIVTTMYNAEEAGMKVGNKSFKVEVLGKARIKNVYKLYGEEVYRQKTISSFIKDNPKGTYMVMVAGHALTIKDSEVYDWKAGAFKPSRKVQSAYRIEPMYSNKLGNQLTLF